MIRPAAWPALAAAAALSLAGCGSSASPSTTTHARAPLPAPTTQSIPKPVPIPPSHGLPKPTTGRGAAVIRAWADALRHGDIKAASRYFALPTLVANGGAPITLHTRADVRFFNETLPCGAVLLRTKAGPHGLVIGTFRLTERPGPGVCGSGVGDTASTAFRIRHGRISGWVRVANPPGSPQPVPQGTLS